MTAESSAATSQVSSAAAKTDIRRVLLVDRAFQLKYAGVFALLGVFAALSGSVLSYYLLPEPGYAFIGTLVIVAAISGGVLGVAGLILTHRVAGPVYVMTRYLSTLVEGRYPSTRPLRDDDELKEFYSFFEKSITYLRTRELDDAFKIQHALNTLTPLVQSPESKQALDDLRALSERKRATTERLSKLSSGNGQA